MSHPERMESQLISRRQQFVGFFLRGIIAVLHLAEAFKPRDAAVLLPVARLPVDVFRCRHVSRPHSQICVPNPYIRPRTYEQ